MLLEQKKLNLWNHYWRACLHVNPASDLEWVCEESWHHPGLLTELPCGDARKKDARQLLQLLQHSFSIHSAQSSAATLVFFCLLHICEALTLFTTPNRFYRLWDKQSCVEKSPPNHQIWNFQFKGRVHYTKFSKQHFFAASRKSKAKIDFKSPFYIESPGIAV